MAVIHMTEEELARDLTGLLAKARAGEDILIEDDSVALRLTRATPHGARSSLLPRYAEPRLLSEILADLEKNSSADPMPEGFASDVEAVIGEHEKETVFDPWAAS